MHRLLKSRVQIWCDCPLTRLNIPSHIKDIHSTLNIRVFDEEKNKYNFLGCVKLPILEAHTIHR